MVLVPSVHEAFLYSFFRHFLFISIQLLFFLSYFFFHLVSSGV